MVTENDIPQLVKTAILQVIGDTQDSNTLDGNLRLAKDLSITDADNLLLTAELNRIVSLFNRPPLVKETDLWDCETVDDCIKLVREIVNE